MFDGHHAVVAILGETANDVSVRFAGVPDGVEFAIRVHFDVNVSDEAVEVLITFRWRLAEVRPGVDLPDGGDGF